CLQSMPSPLHLDILYDEHAPALFGFLLNLTRNEADTRDLMQELFCKLASKPEQLRDVKEMRAYLIRLSHNLAIDLMRRASTRQKYHDGFASEMKEVFASSPNPDEQAFHRALDAALGELPPEQRSVVHLKLWGEFTFEEIAQILEIPLNTAASRYRYGLDKLRERLRPLYDEIQ
ncbi:MAG TPA: sigma-70 family RNA polymerase sigma factor, partial [Candidatus Saccharimonadales bacterium]|nr:sigma-70 family RNA polymerase sigma factor [Candidatus Saccharimonadales bacterium]